MNYKKKHLKENIQLIQVYPETIFHVEIYRKKLLEIIKQEKENFILSDEIFLIGLIILRGKFILFEIKNF